MKSLETFPPVQWASIHPRLAAWIVLSLGMIILLVYEARDVGLKLGNWIALIVATILVAGACILIVSWEDEPEDEAAEKTQSTDTPATPSATISTNTESENPVS